MKIQIKKNTYQQDVNCKGQTLLRGRGAQAENLYIVKQKLVRFDIYDIIQLENILWHHTA